MNEQRTIKATLGRIQAIMRIFIFFVAFCAFSTILFMVGMKYGEEASDRNQYEEIMIDNAYTRQYVQKAYAGMKDKEQRMIKKADVLIDTLKGFIKAVEDDWFDVY